ncbi:MAG: endonuclease/exonuclease/phosphatase family protein, partial [Gemmatimonadaceae bacterium]
FLIGTIVAWTLLKYWSEQTIPATIIAYGPRFLALWPFALLGPAALLFLRRAIWPLVAAALIIAGPIMGYVVNVGTIGAKMPAVPTPGTFRILTFNTQSGNALSYDLAILLKESAPDVFTFQECGDRLWAVIEAQKDWFSKRYGSLCTGSRWEIEETDVMPREELARVSKLGFGGTGLVLRAFVKSPRGRLAVVNLHLETARRGLEGMLGNEGFVPDRNPFNRDTNNLNDESQPDRTGVSQAERFRRNALIRETESERASRWAVSGIGSTPIIIAGDFNLPVESTIFQNHWSHFVDAFESRGNGLGWTKYEGRWLRMRIDHVLSIKGGLLPLMVQVLPDYPSDHRPVLADYAWPSTISSKP